VVGVANHSELASALCKDERPDALLLDLELVGARAAAVTSDVMREAPCPVLLLSTGPKERLSDVYEAMGAGALDVLSVPAEGMFEAAASALVLDKLTMIAKLVGRVARPSGELTLLPKLLAIGASTGGPHAIAEVLARVPRHTRLAIVVVQHVDCEFAEGLASWLEAQTGLPTKLASHASRPQPGCVLVAATNDHLKLTSAQALSYTREPLHALYRPSVDVLFDSLAHHWPKPGIAVLLTGMGRDGAEGLLHLRRKRWHTIAQDEQSSVVFGMPKAAIELGAASRVLPLDEIGPAVAAWGG
jgi:chemotaxis response regulator CheB